ncbi:hypothetical protein O7621_19100 [Solwaraspora sp. WMMD937]|uniref:hypothetical protein n=1 Tax=Solwaraspora sp. WMMD937 TaxID=3016090 RepID=UPI00249AC76A|nr:hypothetical protein [Solwaraspora sp. WMMD937]WFE20016.1 hypothetical protein O7621_19100 [Solwaraspora sp. WMMD937]
MPQWRTNRLAVGASIVALALAAFASGLPYWGCFITFTVGLPYAVLAVPARCGEPLWRDGDCPYLGYGLLLGCDLHRLDKIERLLGAQPRNPVGDRRSASVVAVPPGRGPTLTRHTWEGLGLVAALLGAVAGLLILLGSVP